MHEAEILQCECRSAQELLAKLRTSDTTWTNVKGSSHPLWVFRGHEDATWKLMPSAWRQQESKYLMQSATEHHSHADDWVHKYPTQFNEVQNPEGCSRQRHATRHLWSEIALIDRFAEQLNLRGLAVPVSPPIAITVRDIGKVHPPHLDIAAGNLFAPNDLVALAQHHRIPTRLLDWSLNPLAAAFWAASKITQRPDEGRSEYLAIFALNIDPHLLRLNKTDFKVFRPRWNLNPYAFAQQGVFTWTLRAENHFVQHGSWPSLEVRFGTDDLTPRIRKFTLPASQAGELLKLLKHERVTEVDLTPSPDNIANAVRQSIGLPDARHA